MDFYGEKKKHMKKVIPSYIFWTIVSIIFVSSSFDLFLNVNILGFNVRLAQIFILILNVAFIVEIIIEKRFFILPTLGILWIWGWIMFLFSANSLLILRGAGYGLWLISLIVWVIYLSNRGYYFSGNERNQLIALYILSFFPSIVFGLLQWAYPSLLLSSSFPFKSQEYLTVFNYYHLHRINGFNYEPSYYATYLIVLPPVLWAWVKNEKSIKRVFGLLFLILSIVTLFLSTSRMGWLGVLGFFTITIVIEIYSLLRKYFLDKKLFLKFAIIAITIIFTFGFLFVFNSRYKNVFEKFQSYFKWSYDDRMEGYRNAFTLFFKNPFKAPGLGGVAAGIAFNEGGILPVNNTEAKNYEAVNVLLEVIAGGGIIGSALFIAFWLAFLILVLKRYKLYSTVEQQWLSGLLIGLLLQWLLLIFNQNIIRIYVWNHIAVMACFISFSGREEKRGTCSRIYGPLSAIIIAILSMVIVTLIFLSTPGKAKFYKLELTLKDEKNLVSISMNYYTSHNMFYGQTLQKFHILNIKPIRISNTLVFDVLGKSQRISKGLFYESEKEDLYKWISGKVVPISVQPEIWDYTTNLLSLLYKRDSNFFKSPEKALDTVNDVLSNENLYCPLLLKKFSFSPETMEYIRKENLSQEEKIILNRRILEEVYVDLYTDIPCNPLNHRAYDIDIVFSFNTNILFSLTNEKEYGDLSIDSIAFETDIGRVKLSQSDLYSYFKFDRGFRYFASNRLEGYSTQPVIILTFKKAPIDFFLWYFQKRYIYLTILIITGIISFLTSLYLFKVYISFLEKS